MDIELLIKIARGFFLLKKLVGVLFLGAFLWYSPELIRSYPLIFEHKSITGQILRTETVSWFSRSSSSASGTNVTAYIPFVQYTVNDMNYEVRGMFSVGYKKDSGQLGVIYHPENPEIARVDKGFMTWIDFYIFSFLLITSLMAIFQKSLNVAELREKLEKSMQSKSE